MQSPGTCEHCGQEIFGDVEMVMGVNMHPDCAKDFNVEYARMTETLDEEEARREKYKAPPAL